MAHSLSPRMHNAAFEALGLDWAYVACEVEREELEAVLSRLAGLGYAGANVTTPYKQDVARARRGERGVRQHAALRSAPRHQHRRGDPRGARARAGGDRRRRRRGRGVSRRPARRAGLLPPWRVAAGDEPAPTSSSTRPRRGTRSSFRSGGGQTLVDLPYPGSATAAAARAAGRPRAGRARGARRAGRGLVRALDGRAGAGRGDAARRRLVECSASRQRVSPTARRSSGS